MPPDEITLLVIDIEVSSLRSAHPDIFAGILRGDGVLAAAEGDGAILADMAEEPKLIRFD
jgi:hypothetical protein